MNDKEKKAFVARMKKGKREAAKGKSKSKGGGKSATNPKTKTKKIKFPEDHWFLEYQLRGGKKTRNQYDRNVDIFHDRTLDIFIHGDTSKYKTRNAALNAVKKDAKINTKELNLIFNSINDVTPYT